MKRLAAVAVLGLWAAPTLAIECPVTHAIYEQPGEQVRMVFSAVPRDGAANQIASFKIEIVGTDARFDGGIYVPNGFGQAWGYIGLDCPEAPEDSEEPVAADPDACKFWDGVVYATGPTGIEEYPHSAEVPLDAVMAPKQILLPQFAGNVWYSMMRETAFADDRDVLDTFTHVTCYK